MLTGKGLNWGGSFIRPEATGYGLIYFVLHVRVGSFLTSLTLNPTHQMIAKSCPEHSLDNPSTIVAISGSGNVSQFTALKVIELGATVKSLSDSKGALIATEAFTKEDVLSIGQLKLKGGSLEQWVKTQTSSRFTYYPGKPRFYTYLGSLPLTQNPRQAPLDPYPSHPPRPPRRHPERGVKRGGRGARQGRRPHRRRRFQHGLHRRSHRRLRGRAQSRKRRLVRPWK